MVEIDALIAEASTKATVAGLAVFDGRADGSDLIARPVNEALDNWKELDLE